MCIIYIGVLFLYMAKKNLQLSLNDDSLNVPKLKQAMLKEMYILEASLFNQASLESNRISQLRSIVSKLQDITFTQENMQLLTTQEKIYAYKALSNDLYASLDFVTNLHKNVSKGFELLSEIDKSQKDDNNQNSTVSNHNDIMDINNIKKAILNKIKDKVG